MSSGYKTYQANDIGKNSVVRESLWYFMVFSCLQLALRYRIRNRTFCNCMLWWKNNSSFPHFKKENRVPERVWWCCRVSFQWFNTVSGVEESGKLYKRSYIGVNPNWVLFNRGMIYSKADCTWLNEYRREFFSRRNKLIASSIPRVYSLYRRWISLYFLSKVS